METSRTRISAAPMFCVLLIACGACLFPAAVRAQVAGESVPLPQQGPDVGLGQKILDSGTGVAINWIGDKADNPGQTAAESAGGYVGTLVGGLPGKIIGSKLAGGAYKNVKEKGSPQKQADNAVDKVMHPNMGGPDRSKPYYDSKGNIRYLDKNQKWVKNPDTGEMQIKWKTPEDIAQEDDAAKELAKLNAQNAARNASRSVARPPRGGGCDGAGSCK